FVAVENYCKGKNVEEPLSKDNIPIPDLPINFIWMQVRVLLVICIYFVVVFFKDTVVVYISLLKLNIFVNFQVGAGSKMRNLLGYAIKAFKEERAIVWSGSGAAIGKAISCAEIMKRHFRQAHQITKICPRK
ncbi:Ribonuclease P protein subunit p25-like protein, partial [Blattella germanica]